MRSIFAMEHLFSVTTFCTWDCRHGNKLRLVRLVKLVRDDSLSRQDQWSDSDVVQLPVLRGFKCHFSYVCCFSVIVACRLWINGIAVSMNEACLFVLSTIVMSGQLKLTAMSINKVRSH